MDLFSQRKISLISLALYWPMLLVFAHIPVPDSVRSADVSDKSLHYLAYLVLTFLLWFSIKPHEKVNWRKITVWLILMSLTAYGLIDEIIQSFIGRSCDIMDVVANLSGIFFALFMLTFLSFVPAALIVASIVIFIMANVARVNLAEVFPIAYGLFDLLAYSIFTVFWLLNINLLFLQKYNKFKWLLIAVGIPICFLIIVKLSSFLLGRAIDLEDIILPIAAIITVVMVGYLTGIFFPAKTGPQGDTI